MTISRATLPTEFFDITSQMMLRAAEPAYAYARLLFMGSAQAELSRMGIDATNAAPGRGLPEFGADVPDLSAMQLLIGDSIRGEAIVVSDELAPGRVGHTVRMNRPRFSGGGYTEAARTIASGVAISLTPIDITADQVSITIGKRVGPFAAGGTAPAPYAIDRFDAEHAVHRIGRTVGLHLQRDRTKWIDSVIGRLFDLGSTVIYPGDSTFSLSSDTSAFVVNGDRPMDAETMFRAEQKLNDLSVPAFANGRYMAVLSPTQARQLKSDPQFQSLSTFDASRNPLASSYVGTIGQIEVYQSSTNVVDTATVSNVTIHHGCVFGPGAVGYAGAGPARVAASSEDNYGETPKVVWIAYEGFAVLNDDFILNIHSN